MTTGRSSAKQRLKVVPRKAGKGRPSTGPKAASGDSPLAESFMRGLRADHARLTRVLWVIDELAAHLRADPESTQPILLEAMRYLSSYQYAWHHPREDRLFARIGRRERGHRAHMRALMREHKGGLRGVKIMVDGLAAASPAQLRRSQGGRLARGLAGYVAHLREHMRHEEKVFYAHAEDALDAADWRALAADPLPADPLADPAQFAREYPLLAHRLAVPVHEYASGGRSRVVTDSVPVAPSRTSRHERGTRFIELYGELLHDGFDLLRENLQIARSVRTPADFWRAAVPVCTRSGAYALAWFTRPAHFAQEAVQEAVRSALPGRRATSGKG